MNEKLLLQEFCKIKEKGWLQLHERGNGSAGLYFEELLGVETNKSKFPDYYGIEIKTKCSKKEEYLTLFSMNPKSNYTYTIKYLVENFGYKNADNEYKILFIGMSGKYYKKTKKNIFKLVLDPSKKRIYLKIYSLYWKLLDESIFWEIDEIYNRLNEKCNKMALVLGEKNRIGNKNYVKYDMIQIYTLKNINAFIDAFEKGNIWIHLRIGVQKKGPYKGEPYSHGTSFKIKIENLESIFNLT